MHKNCADGGASSLLQFAMSDEPVRRVVLDGLSGCFHQDGERASARRFSGRRAGNRILFAIPKEWGIEPDRIEHQDETRRRSGFSAGAKLILYGENVPVGAELPSRSERDELRNSWLVVSNGRFAARLDTRLLEKVLAGTRADVVAVNIESDLLGERERVRLTTEGKVAGFRRVYSDSAEFGFIPADWPDHLFISSSVLGQVLADGDLPLSFSAFVEICRSKALTLRAINIGGAMLDLETEDGLLSFCRMILSDSPYSEHKLRGSDTIAGNSRIIGRVLLGKNVSIGANATIVGPVIIGDNVKVEPGAIIHSSIIASGVRVPTNQFLQNCIVRDMQHDWKRFARPENDDRGRVACPRYDLNQWRRGHGSFRRWPVFSYARCLKRITDCLVAMIVLILFAPLMPFVAFAIKLTSPGPVFYRDKRQGLHGNEFDCLKFRTMITGAHAIQEKLRIVSHVDGPQFKMEDDPRISTVGRFLRETYIDEIPQFFNVLFGQMSVVGPRPSPVAENTLCPFWRDARLSVRPGITGLWQLYRTRQPMRDFQEWIYYDVEYVRNLSLLTDLRICWQTTKKLLDNFISQF
ncbi:MAG: sugar transferase [Planctomycetota bacterium]